MALGYSGNCITNLRTGFKRNVPAQVVSSTAAKPGLAVYQLGQVRRIRRAGPWLCQSD